MYVYIHIHICMYTYIYTYIYIFILTLMDIEVLSSLGYYKQCWGVWVAQLVKYATSAQVTISWFMLGSVLTAQSLEPVSKSLCPSLCTFPACVLSVCLSVCLSLSLKRNKHLKN